MKIYHNELTNQVIAVTDQHAECFYVPTGTDPVKYALTNFRPLEGALGRFNSADFLEDTEPQQTPETPTPRADAIKNEGVPKGIPKPNTQ